MASYAVAIVAVAFGVLGLILNAMTLLLLGFLAIAMGAALSVLTEVVGAFKGRTSKASAAGAVGLVLGLCGYVLVVPRAADAMEARRVFLTKAAIVQLARDVDHLHQQTGRLPADAQELTAALGAPMPHSGWGWPLEYRLENGRPGHYSIGTFDRWSNRYFYDSAEAAKGVQLEWF